MSFLAPALLAMLPLMALPILIHLIHRRKYKTVEWGAMMFLLSAEKMARGRRRLRELLTLLFRVLAVGALIFVITRPLATGGLFVAASGQVDTAIVLLDRSASMAARDVQAGVPKPRRALEKLVGLFETVPAARTVFLDSVSMEPREVEDPELLLELSETYPSSAAADVPAMLQAALEYIEQNDVGRTDIWVLSDERENDWDPESGRWKVLRELLASMEDRVQVHLLSLPEQRDNLKVRVTRAVRRDGAEGAELVLDLLLLREGGSSSEISVPLDVVVAGVRSRIEVSLQGTETRVDGVRIEAPRTQEDGGDAGYVELPLDGNPEDNRYYFVFSEEPVRRSAIVTLNRLSGDWIKTALLAPLDPGSSTRRRFTIRRRRASCPGTNWLSWSGRRRYPKTSQSVRSCGASSIAEGSRSSCRRRTRAVCHSSIRRFVGGRGRRPRRRIWNAWRTGTGVKIFCATRRVVRRCPWTNCASSATASSRVPSASSPGCRDPRRFSLARSTAKVRPTSSRPPPSRSLPTSEPRASYCTSPCNELSSVARRPSVELWT